MDTLKLYLERKRFRFSEYQWTNAHKRNAKHEIWNVLKFRF
jgi:hypothetical protein